MSRSSLTGVVTAVAAAALLTACGGGDDASTTDVSTTTTTESTGGPATSDTATPDPSPVTTTEATAPTTSTASPTTTSTVPEPTTRFGQLAGAEMVLLTPPMGNGPKPLLAWEAVDGATTYDVIVNTRDGGPYWAWRGAATQVWLGGHETEPDADTEGPVLVEPMQLTIVATDDSGGLLAAVGPVEIAP